MQEHKATGATQLAAAAVVLLLSAPLPARAATLVQTPEQRELRQHVEQQQQQQQQQQVATAPSLVASPLPSEATADLTAAVAQQVVAATLPPPGDAAPIGAPTEGGLAAAAAAVAGSEAAAAMAAAAAVEGKVADGLRAVGQGANLLEGTMPAVGGAVPASWLSGTPLCSAWQAYCASLQHSPLVTKAATSVVGTFLGDLLAQFIAAYAPEGPTRGRRSARASSDGGAAAAAAVAAGAQQQPPRPRRRSASGSGGAAMGNTGGFEYDAGRALRLAAFAALINTPMAHYWYLFLDAAVSPGDPTAPAAVATKVLLDQGLQTPFGMALFFACLKLFEGRPSEVAPEIRAKLLPSLIANWYVWPAAQLVNFTLVPLDMRILYVNIISIGWTAYISNMASGAAPVVAAKKGAPGQAADGAHQGPAGAAVAEAAGAGAGADGGAAAAAAGRMPLRRAGTTAV